MAIVTPAGKRRVQPVARHAADRRRSPHDSRSPSASPRGTGTSRTPRRRPSSPACRPRRRSRPRCASDRRRAIGYDALPLDRLRRARARYRADADRERRHPRGAARRDHNQRPRPLDPRGPGAARPHANARRTRHGCRDQRASADRNAAPENAAPHAHHHPGHQGGLRHRRGRRLADRRWTASQPSSGMSRPMPSATTFPARAPARARTSSSPATTTGRVRSSRISTN